MEQKRKTALDGDNSYLLFFDWDKRSGCVTSAQARCDTVQNANRKKNQTFMSALETKSMTKIVAKKAESAVVQAAITANNKN